jgi:C4-dicarboxylate-binding protein DctP
LLEERSCEQNVAWRIGWLACAVGPALAQQPIVIKFSHVVTPTRRRARRGLLQEARGGAHQGQGQGRGLSEQPALQGQGGVEALQLGSVQMLAPSLAKFGPLGAREFEVFDLPYPVRQL